MPNRLTDGFRMFVCPECGSQSSWKAGLRKTTYGDVQRYLCRNCGYRFSKLKVEGNIFAKTSESAEPVDDLAHHIIANPNISLEESVDDFPFFGRENVRAHERTITGQSLSALRDYNSNCRVGASGKEAKNLVKAETVKEGLEARQATKRQTDFDVRGKVIEFAFWLKKNGYRPSTINRYTHEINILAKRSANIFDPESIKEAIAKQRWKESRKLGVCHVYNAFLKMINKNWTMPHYTAVNKHPFVPNQKTLEQIIAGTGKKMSTYFQLLMESGMRPGEADKITWADIDEERHTVRVTPEKNSNPRTLKVSKSLIGRLLLLPKTSSKVFGDTVYNARRTGWAQTRKRLAKKLNNAQFTRVTFHSVRHWYATNLYHETKNILLVQRRLGHKSIASTLLYVEIEEELYGNSPDGKFICETTEKPDDAKKLIEQGFDYVGQIHGEQMFRKRC